MFGSKRAAELESLKKSYETACNTINRLNSEASKQQQRIVQLEQDNKKLEAELKAATKRAEKAEKKAAEPPVKKYNSAYHYDDVKLCIIDGEAPDFLQLPIGTSLFFDRDIGNKYDKKAVKVYTRNDIKIGYMYKGKLQKMAYDFSGREDRGILGQVTSNNGREIQFCMDFFYFEKDEDLEVDYDEE